MGSRSKKLRTGPRRTHRATSMLDPGRKSQQTEDTNFPDRVPEVPLLIPLTSKLTGIYLQQQPLREAGRPQRPDDHQYRVVPRSGQNRLVSGRTGTAAQFCCWCRSRHRRHRGQDSASMTSPGRKRPLLQNLQRRENDLIDIQTD